jgi:lysophospholipase L1-like esterase
MYPYGLAVAVLCAAVDAGPDAPRLPPLEPPEEPAFPGQYAPRPVPAYPPAPKRCLEVPVPFRCPCLDWLAQDFSSLRRHAPANALLPPPRPGERRVVFFGDSITDNWARPTFGGFFPGKPYINRGIGSQTTTAMLPRFRSDVISLAPRAVVILAGTNDISGNTGLTPQVVTGGNLAAMVELARRHGIRPVLATLLPVRDGTPGPGGRLTLRTDERPPARIVALNRWIAAFAAANQIALLDYHAALVAPDGQLTRELTDDGVHPNARGYAVMAPLAEAAIARALRAPLARRPLTLPTPVPDGLDLPPTGPVPPPPAPAPVAGAFPGQHVQAPPDDPRRPLSPRACTLLPDPGERCRCLEHRLFNWAGLERYAAANVAFVQHRPGPRPGAGHVLLYGDSLTEGWTAPEAGGSLPGNPILGRVLGRGYSGQTTEQLLARFPHDVLALSPDAVVILGGINDLGGNTGKRTLDEIAGNLASMAELALARGIRPVLVSVLPVSDATQDPATQLPRIRSGGLPPSHIVGLNRLVAAHAARLRVPYVDAHRALANPAGHLRTELTTDGVHLTATGYAALGQAIAAALPRPAGASRQPR